MGGTAIPEDSVYYKSAMELSRLLAGSGISTMTGGGPGIMMAANRGAQSVNSEDTLSYGLRVVHLRGENFAQNLYSDESGSFTFNTLFIRLVTMISNSDAIVLFPGGFGTLEELFSLLVRLRTKMMNKIPVYLFGSVFWEGLVSWIKAHILPMNLISADDLEFVKIEDNVAKMAGEIIKYIEDAG
jgi:uncharacterized protein (TIGR00730 family)